MTTVPPKLLAPAGFITTTIERVEPHRRSGRAVFATVMTAPMALWQIVLFLGPLLFLIGLSFWLVRNFQLVPAFESVNWETMLSQPHFWATFVRTCAYAAGAAALTSLIALPAAYAMALVLNDNQRRLLSFLLVIPFFTSYLVRVYAWQVFLSDQGLINTALGLIGLGPFGMLNTAFGTFVGYLTLSLPLVVLIQCMALSMVDRHHVEAAHNLGCGPLATVFRVVLPSAKAGLTIAALFCFIFSFGDFVSPVYLGGGTQPTLAMLIIDTTKAGQQWPRAAVISIAMIATLMTVAFAATSYAYRRR